MDIFYIFCYHNGMKNTTYFEERNIKNTKMIREKLAILPYFCREFLVGIEMVTSPLTRLGYVNDLKIFFDFLIKNVPAFRRKEIEEIELSDLEKVTVTDLEMFMSYLTHYELDGVTYSNKERGKARKISAVRTMFNFFYRKDKLSENVASKISMPKQHEKEIVRLTTEEVTDLVDFLEEKPDMNSSHQTSYINNNTKQRDLAIITLLLGTGIRVSECVGLDVNDIDFESNAFVVTRKGGNRTTLYFSDEIKELLQKYVEYRKTLKNNSPALFLSLQQNRLSVRAVEYIVKKYAKIISPLKKISPHKLRSTYGTNLYRATKDIYVVAEVLGHKDINTTKKHYAAISEDIKKEAATKVKLK